MASYYGDSCRNLTIENGKHIFNVHWPNCLGLIEGFCTVCEQPTIFRSENDSTNHCATEVTHNCSINLEISYFLIVSFCDEAVVFFFQKLCSLLSEVANKSFEQGVGFFFIFKLKQCQD